MHRFPRVKGQPDRRARRRFHRSSVTEIAHENIKPSSLNEAIISARYAESVNVAQISDMHIKRRGHILQHMPHVSQPLRRVLAAIGRLRPAPD
jgi:hypothetical protein